MTTSERPPRKPYISPVLVIYGDLVQITSVVANAKVANYDGGHGSMDKTR